MSAGTIRISPSTEHCGRRRELVDQRRRRIGRHVRLGRIGYSAGNDGVRDVDRLDGVEAFGSGRSKHVRDTGRRPHRDGSGKTRLSERAVELVLLERDVKEAAEIGVVRPRLEARAHHGHVQGVARSVDDSVDPGDRGCEVARRSNNDRGAEALREVPRASLVTVDDPNLFDARAGSRIGDGNATHATRAADDRDPHGA